MRALRSTAGALTACALLSLARAQTFAPAAFTQAPNHHPPPKPTSAPDWSQQDNSYVLAYVNVTYRDPETDEQYQQGGEIGKYSTGRVAPASGRLVHARSRNGTVNHGCDEQWEEVPAEEVPWVALVQRGLCNFDVKVENARRQNASAVMVYDYREGRHLHRIQLSDRHREGDAIVVVFIPKTQGEDLAYLVDNGIEVSLQISPGTHFTYSANNLNKTSVLFVSVSFILLMVVSLAWLLFYYVQRFRYMHARDRLTKRLICAAKKAVGRIPVKTIRAGDEQLDDGECCAVCLEVYRTGELLRILPCSHEFHKVCVDPWLLKNRTCPMCKMDILKYYGLSSVSEESLVHLEHESQSGAASSLGMSPVRARSVSRASLHSLAMMVPSPACVENLHSGAISTTRARRVSAVLAAVGPAPPRRLSAPARTSASCSCRRQALGRSFSSPVTAGAVSEHPDAVVDASGVVLHLSPSAAACSSCRAPSAAARARARPCRSLPGPNAADPTPSIPPSASMTSYGTVKTPSNSSLSSSSLNKRSNSASSSVVSSPSYSGSSPSLPSLTFPSSPSLPSSPSSPSLPSSPSTELSPGEWATSATGAAAATSDGGAGGASSGRRVRRLGTTVAVQVEDRRRSRGGEIILEIV